MTMGNECVECGDETPGVQDGHVCGVGEDKEKEAADRDGIEHQEGTGCGRPGLRRR